MAVTDEADRVDEVAKDGRLPYEKPRLRVVELATDEVLAVGCKLDAGGFDFGASPCVANNCNQGGT